MKNLLRQIHTDRSFPPYIPTEHRCRHIPCCSTAQPGNITKTREYTFQQKLVKTIVNDSS